MALFRRTSPGTYNASTGKMSAPSVTTWSGPALMKKTGSAQRFEALGLVVSTSVNLLLTVDDYTFDAFSTDFLQPGDEFRWDASQPWYAIKDVSPLAPDGKIILLDVVASR